MFYFLNVCILRVNIIVILDKILQELNHHQVQTGKLILFFEGGANRTTLKGGMNEKISHLIIKS